MKFKPMVILLAIALLLAGCGRAEEAVPTEAPTTVPETMAVELVQTAEPTEQEVVDTTIWLPPYWTEDGKLELHCLVKNETKGNLFVESMQTTYYLNGKIVKEGSYDKNALGKFLWRPFNKLDLTIAASTLLIVNDYPAPDGFDEAIITITTRTEQGQEIILTYHFTMDEEKVTPSTLTDNWELSTSWINDQGGWNWDHVPYNETKDKLTLEFVHHIHYDNGIPVQAETKVVSQFSSFIQTVDDLDPGTSAPYTTGASEQFRNFNQREVTFVYRNSKQQPYLQTFYFVYEDAVSWEEYNTMPEGLDILTSGETIVALGGAQYSQEEIRQMIDDNLTLDEVAEKISTVGDLLGYLNLKGFCYELRGDDEFESNGYKWRATPSAHTVFEQNTADCLSGSNLLNYILRGDYDEQGYVQESALTNGHVFNWFRIDDVYYFVDWTVVDLRGEFGNMAFISYATEDPQTFSDYYIKKSKTNDTSSYIIRLQYMYPREGDQLPIRILPNQKPHIRVLPLELEKTATLLYEDSEHYVLKFQEGPPKEHWPEAAK